jgi:hypothetical protein
MEDTDLLNGRMSVRFFALILHLSWREDEQLVIKMLTSENSKESFIGHKEDMCGSCNGLNMDLCSVKELGR